MIEIAINKRLDTAGGPLSRQIDFSLKKGDFLALYGPSGCGKTSLLRMIAGLMAPDSGKIVVNGRDWFNKTKVLPPQKRAVAMLFQDYALFPNMTVEGNLRFAAANNQSIEPMLEAIQLQQLRDKKPAQLSGGQQQRLALARALVQEPDLLLLDEPFSALDASLATQMHQLLQQWLHKHSITTIMVSHHHPEILQLANKMLVFEAQNCHFYEHPSTYFRSKKNSITVSGIIEMIGEDYLILDNGTESIRIQLAPAQLKAVSLGQHFSVELIGYHAHVNNPKNDHD